MFFWIVWCGWVCLPCVVWGATQTLTNGNDSGAGSLRAAITSINSTGDAANTIQANTPFSIALTSDLPTLNFATTFSTISFDISGQLDFTVKGVALTFDWNDDATFSGNILETGGATSVVKDNANTLTLAGTNTYTGGTTIKKGILVISDNANLGGVNGSITFDGVVTDTRTLDIKIADWSPARVFTFTQSGTLNVESGTTTIDTNLLGTGDLTKSGSGTLVLGGLNGGYTGTINVNVGTLETDSGGVFGSDIVNSTEVIFNQTVAGTYSKNISGIGKVTKIGDAKLTWTGTHSYSGGTTVSAGTLQGDHNSLQGAITNNAAVIFNQTADGAYAGVMSGSGSLTLIGGSKLTLSGANTYSGGTTVSAGTLEGTTTSIQGNIVNNGTVNFNQSTTGTYSGKMSGSGSVVKLGTGTVFLSGSNTYSGGTTVTAGTLQVTTSSLPGPTTNNATLVFNQNFDGTYNSTITGGVGSVLGKIGSGSVFLNGNASATTTTITTGGLFIRSGRTLTSPTVTVATGGELGGGGTIVATSGVTNNGTVSPGDGVGTLTITGNYVHNSSATLKAEITPSIADLLTVSGTATLNGGGATIVPTNAGTRYLPSMTYTVLHADGGRSGTFSTLSISSPSPLFSATYTYLANDVQVTVNVAPFSSVVTQGNPGVVARYLDGLPPPSAGSDLDFVFSQLQLLSLSDLKDALNELQPANYKGLIVAQESNSVGVQAGISSRLEELYKTECSRERACPNHFSIWSDTFGDFLSFRGEKFFNGFKSKSLGVLLGGDYLFKHGISGGLFGGYTLSSLHWNQDVGTAAIDSYYGGLYGGWHACRYFVNASVMGASSRYKASRKMHFLRLNRKAHTSHRGENALVHLDGGALFGYKELELRPFGSLDYLWLNQDAFSETGAHSVNLKVGATDYSMLRTELGFKLANCWWVQECLQVVPDFKLSWVYEGRFGDTSYTAAFKGSGGSFKVRGYQPDVHMLATGFGVTALFAEGAASLSLRYDGEFGKDTHANRGQFEFIYRF